MKLRLIAILLLCGPAFCQTFAVDSVYRNGIIHPHEEHEWVVSDTMREWSKKNKSEWIIEHSFDIYYFTVCRLCGRKLRWSELPPPPPPKTEYQMVDSAWADTGSSYILEKIAQWYNQQPKPKPPKYVILGSDGKPKGFTQ